MNNEETKILEENIKRHMSVLMEDMDKKFAVFIEEQKIIKEKVEKIDLLIEYVDYIKKTLVDNRDRFKEVEERLDKKADKEAVEDYEERLVRLENRALA